MPVERMDDRSVGRSTLLPGIASNFPCIILCPIVQASSMIALRCVLGPCQCSHASYDSRLPPPIASDIPI
ncbi:unnamed protein product [Cercopithifilaria johnstoni]|uniref:Uncharacterized protein n=1 Tax=Cercopithifilaria johnstoni TaxID=2874296 RepID=A0A8J2Q325_9BILA|nr:unnamed protein product [Cercopithifilaria johnstoni]